MHRLSPDSIFVEIKEKKPAGMSIYFCGYRNEIASAKRIVGILSNLEEKWGRCLIMERLAVKEAGKKGACHGIRP